MSYVTYSPDAALRPAEPPPRSRRLSAWFLGALIYVVICVVIILWLKRPPPIKPPLAIIPLTDGTELRFLGAFASREIQLRHSEDFGGRLRTDDYYSRGYGNTSWGSGGSAPNADKPWLVFSRFDPRTQSFSVPVWDQFEVIEDGTGVGFTAQISNGGSDYPVGIASFTALPRRSPELTVRFKHNGTEVTGKLPNPFLSTTTQFVAKPLPQRLEIDGMAFELRGVKLGKGNKPANNTPGSIFQPQPDLKVSALAAPNLWLAMSWSFIDATGNESGHDMLPATDRVWGLRVRARENGDFPFPPDQVISLGRIARPGPGKAVTLTVPQKLKEAGVVGILALGGGTYTMNYATNGIASVFHTGNSGSAVSQTEVAKIPLTQYSASTSVSEFGIWIFSQIDGKSRLTGDLRVRHNGKALQSSGSGSSNNGRRESREYSFGGLKNTLKVGDEIDIEFVYPKERKAEFYFERPKLPGEE